MKSRDRQRTAESNRRLNHGRTDEELLLRMRRLVGRKWRPIIVYRLLAEGPMGFSELKAEIDGISSKVLSTDLEELEEWGIVEREVVTTQPLRVEYSLTDTGRSLEPVLAEMIRWGQRTLDD